MKRVLATSRFQPCGRRSTRPRHRARRPRDRQSRDLPVKSFDDRFRSVRRSQGPHTPYPAAKLAERESPPDVPCRWSPASAGSELLRGSAEAWGPATVLLHVATAALRTRRTAAAGARSVRERRRLVHERARRDRRRDTGAGAAGSTRRATGCAAGAGRAAAGARNAGPSARSSSRARRDRPARAVPRARARAPRASYRRARATPRRASETRSRCADRAWPPCTSAACARTRSRSMIPGAPFEHEQATELVRRHRSAR